MRKKRKNNSNSFPFVLWRIINQCTSGAIGWSPNGSTILIDLELFEQEYLNVQNGFFKTNKILSFVRQLNIYGFTKVTVNDKRRLKFLNGKKYDQFFHHDFNLHRPEALPKIVRKNKDLYRKKQTLSNEKENLPLYSDPENTVES